MTVEQRPRSRGSASELREFLDELWRQVPELSKRADRPPPLSVWWVLRQLAAIVLAHLGVLAGVYLLLLLGDVLFTSYAVALQDAVFVRWVAQPGFLQRMADDVKGAVAFLVGLSAMVQMLVFLWRVML